MQSVPHEGPPAGIVGALFLCILLVSLLLPLLSPDCAAADHGATYRIVVNIPSRTLSLRLGEVLVRRYPVAVGRPQTPSPLGRYRITVKVVNPTWYPRRRPPVPPGPQNPVGTRWLGLNAPNLGIHGTNAPDSIGQAVSGGCIRMRNEDVEELFALVEVGTPVELTYQTVEVEPWPNDEGGAGPAEGEASVLFSFGLAVYPDIYGRGPATVEQARQKITEAGITAELDGERLEQLVRQATGILQPLPVVPRVVISGRPARSVRWEEGRLWLPLSEAAELVGQPLLTWEGAVREHDGVSWVAVADLARRKGYRIRAVPAAATIYLTAPLIFWNGVPVARAFCAGEDVLVPVAPLAEALGRTVALDRCLSVAVGEGGRALPVLWQGEEACLRPEAAASLFAMDVTVTPEGVWFEDAR
ncbi:MAG: L,D-transpeptidase family protein [Betaproteobacteria bacterium]